MYGDREGYALSSLIQISNQTNTPICFLAVDRLFEVLIVSQGNHNEVSPKTGQKFTPMAEVDYGNTPLGNFRGIWVRSLRVST